MRNRRALIVVDVQRDFCEGGALAVEGGHDVARAISRHAAKHPYDLIVTTQDWHDRNNHAGHFDKWPEHCVMDTPGVALDDALALPRIDLFVYKGMGVEGYSGFDEVGARTCDPDGRPYKGSLAEVLRSFGVGEVTVCGLAFDFCVTATAEAAHDKGFEVNVPMNLTAGIYRDSFATVQALLRKKGVRVY